MQKIVIGIDEVGRGPIAGPVTVAAVAFLKTPEPDAIAGANDSKKLTSKKRDELRHMIDTLEEQGVLKTAVHSIPASVIDTHGIVFALNRALTHALDALHISPEACSVKLDGSLGAPETYVTQETIIRGDQKELSIMLASIVAKTTRDRMMEAYAFEYPQYAFERHKGYGTKAHYEAIATHGPCDLHRKTWLKTKVIT